MAFFLIDLCLVEYEALAFKPSLLCASALYVARCTLQITPPWTPLLQKHARYELSQMRYFCLLTFKFLRWFIFMLTVTFVGIVLIWYWSSRKLLGLESWRLHMKNTPVRNLVGLQQWNHWIDFPNDLNSALVLDLLYSMIFSWTLGMLWPHLWWHINMLLR